MHNQEHLILTHLLHADTKDKIFLYIHSLLRTLGVTLIKVFLPAVLYFQLEQPLWMVFLFFGLQSFVITLTVGVSTHLVSKYGTKISMIIGIFLLMLYLFCITKIQEGTEMIFVASIFGGLWTSFFWAGFHYDIADIVKEKKSGEKIALLNVLITVASALTPIAGGLILDVFDSSLLFWVALILVSISIIPLFFSIKEHIPHKFSLHTAVQHSQKEAGKKIFSSFFVVGISYFVGGIIWPLFIFIIVQDFTKLGIIATITTIAIIFLMYLSGKLIDKNKKKLIEKYSLYGQQFSWALIAMTFLSGFYNFLAIALLDSFQKLNFSIFKIPLEHSYYKLQTEMPTPIYAVVLHEWAIHSAQASIGFFLAGLLYLFPNIPLFAVFITPILIFILIIPIQKKIFS